MKKIKLSHKDTVAYINSITTVSDAVHAKMFLTEIGQIDLATVAREKELELLEQLTPKEKLTLCIRAIQTALLKFENNVEKHNLHHIVTALIDYYFGYINAKDIDINKKEITNIQTYVIMHISLDDKLYRPRINNGFSYFELVGVLTNLLADIKIQLTDQDKTDIIKRIVLQ